MQETTGKNLFPLRKESFQRPLTQGGWGIRTRGRASERGAMLSFRDRGPGRFKKTCVWGGAWSEKGESKKESGRWVVSVRTWEVLLWSFLIACLACEKRFLVKIFRERGFKGKEQDQGWGNKKKLGETSGETAEGRNS